MASVKALNRANGEYIELPANTFEQVVTAYRIAQHYEKVAKELKDQLKKQLPKYLDEHGMSPVSPDGYIFKVIESQRMTYNKMALRSVFDDDTIDLFMEVSKGKVDAYIKEHDLSPDEIAELKAGLEPASNVITSTRLEKVG